MSTNRITKSTAIIAVAIFLTNLFFRYFTLTDCGIWYDEAFSIFYSQKELYLIKNTSQWDIAPPFYYYLLHYWMILFGVEENAVRMLSVLFTCIASSLLFIFVHRYFNLRIALFASILFFTSNEIFYYSQETRTYSLLVFFAVASSFCFIELIRNPKWYWMVMLATINWAAIYSHYFFLFIPAIQFVTVLFSGNKKTIFYLVLSFVITALLFGNWLNRIYEVLMHGSVSNEITTLHLHDLFKLIKSLAGESILFYSLLPLVVAGIFYFLKSKNKFENNFQYLTLIYVFMWALFPVLIIYILSNGRGGIFISRYLLYTIPAFCILLSFFISKIPVHKKLYYPIVLVALFIGLFSINYNFSKSTDYKNLVPYVMNEKNKDALVIVQTTAMIPLFTYYFDRNIFINHTDLEKKMMYKNVIFKDDSSTMDNYISNGYSKVILIQSFQPNPDNIVSYLNKRFKTAIGNFNFPMSNITVFSNPFNDSLFSQEVRFSTLMKNFMQTKYDLRFNYYKNQLMNSEEWLNSIRKQSLDSGIHLDTVLKNNIIYLINQENNKQ